MSINNVNIMFEETKQMKGIDVRDTLADMFSLGDWFFFSNIHFQSYW